MYTHMYTFKPFPMYFIWNNSQLLCLVNKNVGTCIYIEDQKLPSESMYVPVYMCVFNFFSETTGPLKPKFMWNHTYDRRTKLIQLIQVFCCSSLLSAQGRRRRYGRSGHGRTTFLAENCFGRTTFSAEYDFFYFCRVIFFRLNF